MDLPTEYSGMRSFGSVMWPKRSPPCYRGRAALRAPVSGALVLWVLLPLLLALACVQEVARPPASGSTPVSPSVPSPTAEPTPTYVPEGYAIINGCVFLLEVPDTPEKRARGLMERPSLPRNRAMLFDFGQEEFWPFWMYQTLIPLDVLFLDSDVRVVDIQTMHPEPGVPRERLPYYRSRARARYGLEMNAGLAQALGFQVGDSVELRLGGPPPPSAACP